MNIKLRPLIVIAYPHPGLNVRKIIYIIILKSPYLLQSFNLLSDPQNDHCVVFGSE